MFRYNSKKSVIPLAVVILILFFIGVFGPKITGLFTSTDKTEITELDSDVKYNEKKATTTHLIFVILVILSLIILIARKKYFVIKPVKRIGISGYRIYFRCCPQSGSHYLRLSWFLRASAVQKKHVPEVSGNLSGECH